MLHVSCGRDSVHSDVDFCLCLLDCLLSNRPVIPEEDILNSNAVFLSPYPSFDSSIQLNRSHPLLSASSASSLNSLPVSPSTNFELTPFMPNKLSSDSLSSDSKLMENNLLPHAEQKETEEVTCSKQLLENSSSCAAECMGLLEEFTEKPLPFSDGLNLSSFKEGLTAGEGNPYSEAKDSDHFEGWYHLQTELSNKELPSKFDHNSGTHAAGDVDSEVVHCRELQSARHHTVWVNPKQSAACESVTQLSSSSSSSVSESSGVGTLLNECGGPTLLSLENELAAFQCQIHELQEQANQLEEQLKKSETEKQQLQAELGRYLFLEDKGRRNAKLQLLSRESGSDQSRSCAGSAYSTLTSMDGRLLSGAGPLQEPSKSTFLHGMPAGQTVSSFWSGIFFFFIVASNLHINLCIKLCSPLEGIYYPDCLQQKWSNQNPLSAHMCDLSRENHTNGYPFERQNAWLLNG